MTVTAEPPIDNPIATILTAYETHALSAYSLAWRVTHNPDLAAEAVQDAFLCLWRTRTSYRPDRCEIGLLLHTIVYRRAIDVVRRNVRQPKPLALHLVAQQITSIDTGPEEYVCRAEDIDRLRRAVLALPLKTRKPLVLAYYYGLTHPEIAGELGVPLGTVKTRIMAARRDLRAVLIAEHAST